MPSTVENSRLEILVVSYGSAATVDALLASLAVVAPDVPVAIREHGPDPLPAPSHTAPVRVEHDPSNPGFAAGCNALAAGSAAEYVVFLNPDTELVAWPWSGDARPPAGTVLGPLMVDSGPPSEHYGVRYRIRDEIARSWLRRRPPRPDGVGYVSGAALLIERAAFAQLGGFDERFFLFYEDIDLCLRANAAGIPTRLDERWTVRHRRHSTTATSPEQFARALQWSYESAAYFHGKHGSPVGAYRVYVLADSLLRAALHTARRDRARARAYLMLARRTTTG